MTSLNGSGSTVFTSDPDNNSSAWRPPDPTSTSTADFRWRHPALAMLLCTFAVGTVAGNLLVMAAVVLRANLHTPTGFLVFSLAVADLCVGVVVMPLNILYEMYDHVWLLGLVMCDVWHSMDVLASTSSIWSLCVIALDRYVAVKHPLNYAWSMTRKRVLFSIAGVWTGSALIAFPAVAWWRTATPDLYLHSDQCQFTNDLSYLAFSSLLSFYLPLFIIIFAYARVYIIASKHQQSLLIGRKQLACSPGLYIRMHRGGGGGVNGVNGVNGGVHHGGVIGVNGVNGVGHNGGLTAVHAQDQTVYVGVTTGGVGVGASTPFLLTSRSRMSSSSSPPDGDWCSNRTDATGRKISANRTASMAERNSSVCSLLTIHQPPQQQRRRQRPSALVRLLAKESKAAKTLSIVVGCFVLCWLPFFFINVVSGVCGEQLGLSPDSRTFEITFAVVTWLGHCNSFLNPIIYTCFSREFRQAFASVLFCNRWSSSSSSSSGLSFSDRRPFGPFRRLSDGRRLSTGGSRPTLISAIENSLRVLMMHAGMRRFSDHDQRTIGRAGINLTSSAL